MTEPPVQLQTLSRRTSLVGFLLAALALSAVPVAHLPLEWFETLFHELSHGLAALATGGSAVRMELRLDGSGTMWTAGGWPPLVSFSGYAGAVTWGAALYRAASATGRDGARRLAFALLIGCLASAILWARDLQTVFILGVVGGLLWAATRSAAAPLARPALRLAGAYVLVSGARAPTHLLVAGIGVHHDAAALRASLLLPEVVWVMCWIACAAGAAWALWKAEPRTRAVT